MTKQINDGGPAFPESALDPREPGCHSGGMRMLDYFARGAMGAYIIASGDQPEDSDPKYLAHCSYNVAEAMIAERERRLVKKGASDD